MTGDVSTVDTLPGGTRTGELLAGKYRLVRLLGRGGMGEVYEARHVVVGRRFAVKFLHAQPTLGSGAAARFLREAQAAGALESPHIAAVIDFDSATDGAPFMVMEYLEGQSLARVLRSEQRLPVPRVVGLLLQACAGLATAHAAGIVHRDLKPDNLFLVERPDGAELLKIVDFGIAKLVGEGAAADVTQSGAVLGTPHYMAPEQARGERAVDHRVDIHALGLIAYELLCGKKPHPGDSYNAILAHILTEPVVSLGTLCPGLPKELIALIERAMAFDPAARYQSVSDLATDLARFAGEKVQLRGEAVDLSRGRQQGSQLETRADTSAAVEAPGTLQSAVGDVPMATTSSQARGAWWRLPAVAAAVAAVVWWLGSRPAAPASSATASAPEPARALPQASAESALPAASAPGSSAQPEAKPHGAPQAVPRPRTAASAFPRGPQTAGKSPPPPPAASFQTAPAQPVTFDEKNPY